MKKRGEIELDFMIDGLINSIKNTISGDSFRTDVLPLTNLDVRQVTKKNGWNFDWKNDGDCNSLLSSNVCNGVFPKQ